MFPYSFVFQMIAWFVWRQIKKWGADLNWERVKIDAEIRVRKLMPGEVWDERAVLFVDQVIDLIKDAVLAKGVLKENYCESINFLKDPVLAQGFLKENYWESIKFVKDRLGY